MASISWCLKQKNGIELIAPNDNLFHAYINEAKETLQHIGNNGKWDIIMAYYSCYNALYAVLMKAGVKSEIHDCTIELMREISFFDDSDYLMISELKTKRINAQYYLKFEKLDNFVAVKRFVQKCELNGLDFDFKILRDTVKHAKN